jgi:hypothetical protein
MKTRTDWIESALLAWAAGLIVALLVGCESIPVIPTPIPVPNAGVHGKVAGLFCGLTMTSPDGANQCPGCDIDCTGLARDAESEGVAPVVLLNNSECTWANIKAQAMTLAAGLKRGDMLVFTLSGHGTQLDDDNGDEPDGKDEALCLFTAGSPATIDIVRDDRVMTELLVPIWAASPGLDVLLVTDTCHAQGNFRAVWDWATLAPASDRRLVKADSPVVIDGGLIQIAMCREDSYSYGSPVGGTGTQALLSVRQGDIGRLATFYATKKLVSASSDPQVPQWVEFGSVSEMFRNGRFWR